MHAAQLVDLASILAFHGPALLFRRELVSEEAMQSFWVSSRARFDEWHRRLGNYKHLEDSHSKSGLEQWWQANEPLLDEILLSEPLTRIYAAIGVELDNNRDTDEISPITQSVYLTHTEARNRVLQIILTSRVIPLHSAVRINSLRTISERWCDALLGHLRTETTSLVEAYGYDGARVRAFADDASQIPRGTARATAGWLLSAAMRDSLLRRSEARSACPLENRAVGDSVLICLRPDLFDSVGLLKSLWLHRLERGAEQTDRVLDQLACSDLSSGDILGGYEAIRDSTFGRW